jgi:F420-dependent oxidoreductase-like protein
MQFGLQVNPYHFGSSGNPWDAVAEAARVLDASRFDSLWLYDHFLYEGGYSGHPFPEPAMECFTALGAVAAITERVRLGQLVLGIPYRNPALLTKQATTLDQISHGRTILGIGAGWHKREYEGYGYGEFEDVPVRMKRLEEAVQVVRALWTQNPASYEGKFYRLQEVKDNPAPIQKPHPPIMIGGSGEKVTLRLVARYAQWCNVSGSPERVAGLLATLREHCERAGRPFDEITRSSYTTVLIGRNDADVAAKRERWNDYIPTNGALIGTPEQLIPIFQEYARIGIQYCIFRTPDWVDLESIRLFSEEVIPALA